MSAYEYTLDDAELDGMMSRGAVGDLEERVAFLEAEVTNLHLMQRGVWPAIRALRRFSHANGRKHSFLWIRKDGNSE